jgi:regulator of RNase E activity RraA
MTDQPLSREELAALATIDTPTVCNALELLAPERRLIGYTTRPLVVVHPDQAPIVGYARTATIRAVQKPTRPAAEMRAQRLEYYRYVATGGPGPGIPVIQDLDPVPGYGAFWGEVQSNIHKGLGCPGGITDGSIRDLSVIPEGFNLLAGSVGPSHAWVHLVDIGTDVNIHGMVVGSNDLIHADRHGAVVIPHAVARKVMGAADLLARREAVILEAAKAPGFDVEALARAMGEADEIH